MNIVQSFLDQIFHKFYTGLRIYVDYQNGLSTNDGLTPQTPVDTVSTAMTVASNFGIMPKLIVIMRGLPSKKGDILNEPVLINIPNTAIDFGYVNLQMSTDGLTSVVLGARWTGVFNANIDNSQQATGGYGVDLGFDSHTFVINSQIQGCKTAGILGTSGFYSLVLGNSISFNDRGLEIRERAGVITCGNIFLQNSVAIRSVGGDGQAFVSKNVFFQNLIDFSEEQYYYTATDGVGSLNKLTSTGSVWTPGEYAGFMLIDSNGKAYKIVNNTENELIIVGVNLDGTSRDVTPADGEFWICHSFNDVFLYENYWDKLQNASTHIYGDSNEDGVLDRLIQMPEQGVGPGKSSVIDIKPLTLNTVISQGLPVDFNALLLNHFGGKYYKHKRVDAVTDIPDRNIVAGMTERIEFKVGAKTVRVLFKYDSLKKDVLEIYDVQII